MEQHNHNEEHHIVPYWSHAWVWVALLILTIVTVAIADIHLPMLTVVVALLVATVKASIVAIYFMHLKFDSKVLAIMFIVTMIIFIAFMSVTFLDYSFR
ncbi:MAG TPA: cytochrome-c oxidase [Bacteroidales bacterium]|nr:cytochrome-c oxidase [Bacteroidales bacterium]